MSTYSDYANAISDIQQYKGDVGAQAAANKGTLIGSTIANLGAQIPKQVQEAISQAAERRKQAQIQQIFADQSSDMSAKIQKVIAIDPEMGSKLGKEYGEAQKLAFEIKSLDQKYKKERADLAYGRLASAQNESQWASGLLGLHEAGEDVSGFDQQYSPEAVKRANLMLADTKTRLEQMFPTPPKLGTRVVKTMKDGVAGEMIVKDEPGQFFASEPDKLPASVEALQLIAANPKDPRQKDVQDILKNLPPDMDPAKNPTEWATIQKAVNGDPEAKKMLSTYMSVHPPVATVIQTATGPQMLNQRAATTTPITTQGGDAIKPAVTQPQAQDATFAKRLDDSSAVLEKVGDDISKMDFVTFKAQSLMPPAAQSTLFQRYDQAARNLINSIMRRESGAAIASDEWVNARLQYLPQPGDSPEVKKQKKQNRERQREGFIQGAGPAYTPSGDKVRVKGPNGETGTVPKGTPLPPGWSLR